MSFLAAFRFLTSIPTPWWRAARRSEFAGSLLYYPVIGLLIGLILAAFYWLASLFLPVWPSSAIVITALVVITGGMHLDGLTDAIDGVAASHKDPAIGKDVMKKPGIGAFGAVAVILVLILKIVLLASLPDEWIAGTLIIMPVISRWTMVYNIFAYPYARPQGAGNELKQATGWHTLVLTTVATLVFSIAIAGWVALAIIIPVWLFAVIAARYFCRRFEGLTGDTYGAISEMAEVLILLVMVIITFNNWV